jgi:hypothetical protein
MEDLTSRNDMADSGLVMSLSLLFSVNHPLATSKRLFVVDENGHALYVCLVCLVSQKMNDSAISNLEA